MRRQGPVCGRGGLAEFRPPRGGPLARRRAVSIAPQVALNAQCSARALLWMHTHGMSAGGLWAKTEIARRGPRHAVRTPGRAARHLRSRRLLRPRLPPPGGCPALTLRRAPAKMRRHRVLVALRHGLSAAPLRLVGRPPRLRQQHRGSAGGPARCGMLGRRRSRSPCTRPPKFCRRRSSALAANTQQQLRLPAASRAASPWCGCGGCCSPAALPPRA